MHWMECVKFWNTQVCDGAEGSILSSHEESSDLKGLNCSNFTYTSTPPVALHQTHEIYSDPAEVHQTPLIPRVLYDIATASPVTPNPVVGVDQHSTGHPCPMCGTRLGERKAFNRHMRDRHGRQNVCPCGFLWSPARNYLFENHVRRDHGGVSPITGNDVPL
ncbi:hypothetical protein BGW80DRAFT_308758 [Lactifluus volemus]|nr:hypothetical protein BGW80DRAFT_308758 [Lactifluus volemus]